MNRGTKDDKSRDEGTHRSIAMGDRQKRQAVHVQMIQFEKVADPLQDEVESPLGQCPEGVFVSELVGRVQPNEIAFPFSVGSLDGPGKVSDVARSVGRREGEKTRFSRRVVVKLVPNRVVKSYILRVGFQRGR